MESQAVHTKKTNERGITLIALVVTIVVLLILAGISISIVLGEGGIIDAARKAGELTNAAIANEQQMLQNIVDWADEYLSGNGGSGDTNTEQDPQTPPTQAEEKTTDEIAKEAEKWIGQEVEYENKSSSSSEKYKWRIFYAGKIDEEDESEENHIYLIANDYIEFNDAPTGKSETALTTYDSRRDGKSYQLSMDDVINDYTGTSDITEEKLKKLNNSYFYTKGYSDNTNVQGKALAFMMDTRQWGEKFGGNLADYVIGGPTIELLFKAYNKKYDLTGNNEYKAEAFDETESSKGKGYKISKDGGENYSISIRDMLTTDDRTFVISNTDKCSSMWVASPSDNDYNDVIGVYYNGETGRTFYNLSDKRLASLSLFKI